MKNDVDVEQIKRLAIVAMFSDDALMERLVLKGGNLLDLVYNVSTRASVDVDLSIDGDFDSFEELKEKVEKAITTTFEQEGLVAFDINVRDVPPNISDDMKSFWGGYKIDFKLIARSAWDELNDLDLRRRNAISVGKRGSTKFAIDLSKHEYCDPKETRELDGYTIFVYTPVMFVSEKIRAICQQMPKYVETVYSHSSARARDFVDIVVVVEKTSVDFCSSDFRQVLKATFGAKRVPLDLIAEIRDYRDYHEQDFETVLATVKPNVLLREFDYYFDYVVEKCRELESLWNE